jgi:Sec-independent protein translocase protein TatA
MGRLGVILAAALIVLTPRDFLRIARTLGPMLSDLRRGFDDLTETLADLEPTESEDPAPSRTI